ncbi:MAG: hypothetical protein HC786_06465 [Richelia sp. CSU_2_1]|nr:hypothetical protein [Microcoleus sp. SU_5_6]NJL67789.1 hypothetical protein [Microcoleus sp. SM1_3_4]NJR21832.1 hypothetical protein [Richelia sp. CSU_2_1]
MDYPFENLNSEKFQEFAQALLAKEFPDFQCFPVAQPDGGRDIIAYEYKVSFVNLSYIYNLQKWLSNGCRVFAYSSSK